ncbi:hypothetical protein [Streptomyces sp. NPDC007205]|uniref:hypothetical protein n=1 Tax=Streptomyces sp. NPDC007205 TaxID=3154316 RepID=UPI00340CDDA6
MLVIANLVAKRRRGNARSRVRLLPVAQAQSVAVREARAAAGAVFSDLAVTDLGSSR